jgi:hypothetical protein
LKINYCKIQQLCGLREMRSVHWRHTGTYMFIVALLTIAKIQNQLRYPSMDE